MLWTMTVVLALGCHGAAEEEGRKQWRGEGCGGEEEERTA